MEKVGQYEIQQSVFKKDSALYEFRFFAILDTILKMLIVYTQNIYFVKIHQVTHIGLRIRCPNRNFIQKNFKVIKVIVWLYKFRP